MILNSSNDSNTLKAQKWVETIWSTVSTVKMWLSIILRHYLSIWDLQCLHWASNTDILQVSRNELKNHLATVSTVKMWLSIILRHYPPIWDLQCLNYAWNINILMILNCSNDCCAQNRVETTWSIILTVKIWLSIILRHNPTFCGLKSLHWASNIDILMILNSSNTLSARKWVETIWPQSQRWKCDSDLFWGITHRFGAFNAFIRPQISIYWCFQTAQMTQVPGNELKPFGQQS